MSERRSIRSTLLDRAGVGHEFGQREAAPAPVDLATSRQVHGIASLWAGEPGKHATEADVLLARTGVAVGVVTADCVPVMIASPGTRLAAAVHAGWRGTLAGAVSVAVRELLRAGAEVRDLRVAIGPAIGPCCYEVSVDLAQRFAERFGPGVVAHANGRTTLDLQQANLLDLAGLGVAASHIEVLYRCTLCELTPEGTPRFHSFRRDGKEAGRQISYVRPR